MNPLKVIGIIIAVILIFFGVLFIWGAFSPEANTQSPIFWILTGLLSIVIGFVLIWFSTRQKPSHADSTTVVKLDLSGQVKLDTMKCQSCGGALAPENITMVAGAPVVTCPYCKSTYQLTEEPKW